MTFSDARVAEFVNKHFVAAWINRGPGFHNERYGTEHRIYRSAMEAYPTKNICTFFMTPEGQVFDYVAGAYAPEIFLVELQSALEIKKSLHNGIEAFRAAHQRAAKKTLPRCADLPDYRGTSHKHSKECANAVATGQKYFSALHDHWSKAAALPWLAKIRYDYLYADPFTEESRNATKVRGTCIP